LEASTLSRSFHQNVINTQQTAILLWQRVRESNPETLIQQARRGSLKRLVTRIDFGNYSGGKIEYLWDLFSSPREFPIQLSPVFRMVFQRMTDIEKGFADNHGDRRISDVSAFFRGLSFRRFRRKR
jgi:hypothetical protein